MDLSQLRLPVVAAPMFLVSGIDLVKASCRSGIIGTFPALNQRTTEAFEEWVVEMNKELSENPKAAPYGVNLIVHRSNPRLQADLEICLKHKVPLIITSLGAVPDLVAQVHSYGGKVFHDVTNRKHAMKAAEANVDGLIAVCAGAGGHAGTISPFSLIGELRQFFNKTILAAGSISNGRDVLAAQAMGADLAYMGTRFINTQESQATSEYKQMIVDTASQDILHTAAVSGVPANFMIPSLEKAGLNLKKKGEVDFGDKLTLDDETKVWKNIWSAGHGVSNISDVLSVSELVDRLESEYMEAHQDLQNRVYK